MAEIRASRIAMAAFVAVYVLIGWLVPFAFILQLPRFDADVPWILLLTLHVASLRIAWISALGRSYLNVVDTAFWAFVYVFFGVTATLQRLAGVFPWTPSGLAPDDFRVADVIVVIGVCAYVVGRVIAPALRYSGLRFDIDMHRTLALAGFVGVVWTVGYLALFGWEAVIVDRTSRGAIVTSITDTSAIATLFGSLISSPPLALLPVALLILPVTRRRSWLVLVIVLLIVANLVINNFVNAARYTAGTVIIGAVLAYLVANARRRVLLRFVPIAIVLALLIIFPFADRYRSVYQSREVRPVIELLIANGDFDAYVQVANGVQYVGAVGTMGGVNLVGAAGFWVPRGMWPAKPRPTGEYLAEHAGFEYVNLSAPLWIEGFVAFGFAGTIALLSMWGLVSAALDKAVSQYSDRVARQRTSVTVGLAVVFAAYSLFLLRGALMPTLAYAVPIVLVMLMTVKVRPVEKLFP